MDSFELNKILGAILGTLLFVMGLGFLAEAIYHPIEGRGPGFALASAAPESEGGEGGEVVQVADIGTLLASADPAAGQAAAKVCSSCHNFGPEGKNGAGPGLYGVVGRLIGSHEGFAYSDGMLEHKDKGDLWSYENLDTFLTAPKSFTPGTKMNFGGLKDDKKRADVIAYLSTLAVTPVPFPAPAAAAPAEAAPAADAAAPAAETAPAATEVAPAATEAAPAATETAPAPAEAAPAATEAAPAATEAAPAAEPAAPAAQ